VTAAAAAATAAVFIWLGMVVAISFLESPLKFRAPGVTIPIGLGIGRLVFRALNTAEAILAAVLLVAAVTQPPPARVLATGAVAVALLLVPLAVVRPRLSRRSDRVLEGDDAPRSHAHYAYVALELVKAIALLATGILLFTSSSFMIKGKRRRTDASVSKSTSPGKRGSFVVGAVVPARGCAAQVTRGAGVLAFKIVNSKCLN
jgi:hypothetical protein